MTSIYKKDASKYKDISTIDQSSSAGANVPLLQRKIRISSARRLPPPPWTTAAAVFMLIAGTAFLTTGLYIYFSNLRVGSDRGLAMVLLGFLMFTPGSYASFVLYGAYSGWTGYDYSQIPSYDDEY
jgi:hypothetical protein